MKRKTVLSITAGIMICLAILLIPGCKGSLADQSGATSEGKPTIAVTIVPEKTFVEAVCGDLANVVTMVPPGSSPENYEPTPKEMEQFSNAKLYFSIGVSTEAANIMPKAKEVKNLKIVSLQDEVAKTYPDLTFSSGERDPHIWLSPKRAAKMVEIIAQKMSLLDPAHKGVYEKNAQEYLQKLTVLDQEIQTALANVKNRKFIVFHPAFGYLADDYKLEMCALEEEGKEATPQRLQEMIDLAKAEQIKAIFYQAEISSKQAQSFADEIGGKTVQLEPLSADYIENLEKMAKLMAEVMQ